MKRDMDLIRRLLLETENLGYDGDRYNRTYLNSWFDGVEDDIFFYHVKLLDEAGYIESLSPPPNLDDLVERYFPYSLTWAGHELLDSIRDSDAWEKVKKSLGKNLSTVPFTVLATVTAEMAKVWALKKLGLN
ncbi:DUF2513 domain-containing protein [Paenibacillus rubinfantis]|uniref:DUF2513 domain-containing protein n=1 Tax=Paenibacillus rubinfantis TaxID=1720296 RepID=UPI00073EF559|nr:DUF2513 domain-containing protein [Paenibacillus rubinfantis]